MGNLNIVDQFLATFITYLDSGFGLLKGDVGHLTSLLIAIDVTIAALFWTLDEDGNILGRLIKKVLYVGAFSFILNNFQMLAGAIFNSFSQLGLDASANNLSASDLLKPGKLAGLGFAAAHPLLSQANDLAGRDIFWSNIVTVAILLLSWLIVLLAFFVLSIQLFIIILEFKLTTLAGFVLVPFAFWNRTAFLAERVLGNVMTSGIKVMVMAVIIGIGSTFFTQYVANSGAADLDLSQVVTLLLMALTLLGLGVFGPAIASGLVAGAPQLGAGAALGTLGLAAGTGLLAANASMAAGRLLTGAGGLDKLNAATSTPGGESKTTPSNTDAPSPASGGPKKAAQPDAGTAPDWAKDMQRQQVARAHLHTVQSSLASGDRPMPPAHPDISEKD